MTQLEHQANPGKTPSQCDKILERLRQTPGEWVGVLDLHQLTNSLAVHSRINDLRQRGHTIAHQNIHTGATIHSSYRLITDPKEAQAHDLASEYQT